MSLTRESATDTTPAPHPEGIDVSQFQLAIDWPTVALHKAFAYVRFSDGRKLDTRFAENWEDVREVGLPHGAYQYFRASLPEQEQADAFLKAHGEMQHGTLPPMLDLETFDGTAPISVIKSALRWIDHVERSLRVVPILYTYPAFWMELAKHATDEELAAFGAMPLWVAHYGVSKPLVPKPWTKALLWQKSGDGHCEGIRGHVDEDVFYGTEEELRALAGVQGESEV